VYLSHQENDALAKLKRSKVVSQAAAQAAE
jgi:hypothetical protein